VELGSNAISLDISTEPSTPYTTPRDDLTNIEASIMKSPERAITDFVVATTPQLPESLFYS